MILIIICYYRLYKKHGSVTFLPFLGNCDRLTDRPISQSTNGLILGFNGSYTTIYRLIKIEKKFCLDTLRI